MASALPYVDVARLFGRLLRRFGNPVKTVVEWACGTGNLTLPLARLGYEITGLDRSPEMLAIARRKATQAELEVSFRCQDLRDPPRGPQVDAVICFFGGLNFLTSQDQLRRGFEAAREALAPGGLLLFDQFTGERMRQLFSGEHRTRREKWSVKVRSRARSDGHIRHRVVFERPGRSGWREVEVHHLRIHPFEEIETLLAQTGFEMLHREEIGPTVGSALLMDDQVFLCRSPV